MTKYNQEFKLQAVKKVLSRSKDESVSKIAEKLNIASSTLWKWIKLAKTNQLTDNPIMSKEKSPQDWNLPERFEALMETQALNEQQTSQYCREKGIYPHHLKQWKASFIKTGQKQKHTPAVSITGFRKEINQLKKELRRKEKALAETAALLVLSKKCQAFWSEQKDV